MTSAAACYSSGKDLSALSHVLSELGNVLVIDEFGTVNAELANLFSGALNCVSRSIKLFSHGDTEPPLLFKSNELQIDVNEICSASPFSGTIKEEEIYPTLPDGLNGALDASRVKTYLKNSMYPLMYLFGKNSMPDVDNLLTSFYQLDDEARQEVVETIRLKLQYHRDPKRAEQIKQIKGW